MQLSLCTVIMRGWISVGWSQSSLWSQRVSMCHDAPSFELAVTFFQVDCFATTHLWQESKLQKKNHNLRKTSEGHTFPMHYLILNSQFMLEKHG